MEHSLKQLAEFLETEFIGDPTHIVTGVADISSALTSELSFIGKGSKNSYLKSSRAGIVCIHKNTPLEEGKNYLLCENPELAFQKIVDSFSVRNQITGFVGVHPTAVIHETAKIGKGVTLAPYVVVDQGAVIGDRVTIGSFSYIGSNVSIDDDTLIHAHVTIREECEIGKRTIIQPGVVIGSCGYGYTQNERGEHIKLTHLGNVVIEEDVEVGANSAVDRARFRSTTISQGTKIDNLVQIAHNVVIGKHNIIVGQTGIAGSTETGNHVMIGGQAAIDGHLKICDFVLIAARAGVTKSLLKPGKYAGIPAIPLKKHNRISVLLRNIESYVEKLK